jgi:hypothetical protein
LEILEDSSDDRGIKLLGQNMTTSENQMKDLLNQLARPMTKGEEKLGGTKERPRLEDGLGATDGILD